MIKWLQNMKIGQRLIAAFVIVAVIASIGGIVGIFVAVDNTQSYSTALVENGFSQGEIGRFNTQLNKGATLVRDIILFTKASDIEAAQAELEQAAADTNQALADLKVNCQTPEELALIAVFDENLPLYREQRDAAIALGIQNKNDEALELFRSKAEPYLDKCVAAADELAALNVTLGNNTAATLSSRSTTAIIMMVAVVVIAIILGVALGIIVAQTVAKPVEEIEGVAKEMAQGNLSVKLAYKAKDEIGSLADNMRTMAERINYYMTEISAATEMLAAGDLNVKELEPFLGDFEPVQKSLRTLVASLDDTMGQINQSSDQVASGSNQVSSGAQALSQGATEQASSVEELAATINEISQQVKDTAQNAEDARSKTAKAGELVNVSNGQMHDMIEAMNEISDKSGQIGRIIKTIEDIAFQTNILALNAAVEAARAGAAGKGFAVVADEVRSLASKSAEASKNTATLIDGAIQAIDRGTNIASLTAESLSSVVESTQEVVVVVDKIANAADEQAASVAQVTQGIDQISSVVQTNSATAEESAAASEELSGQAQMLKELVGHFKLRENGTYAPSAPQPAATTVSAPASIGRSDKY